MVQSDLNGADPNTGEKQRTSFKDSSHDSETAGLSRQSSAKSHPQSDSDPEKHDVVEKPALSYEKAPWCVMN